MIKRIIQIDGENYLEILYESGARRFVGLLDHTYALNKTQRDFMNRATARRVDLAPWADDVNLFMTVWELTA